MNLQDLLAALSNNTANNNAGNAGNLDLNQIQQLMSLMGNQNNNQANLDPAILQMMLQQKQQPKQPVEPVVDTDIYDELSNKISANAENICKFNKLVDHLVNRVNELAETIKGFTQGTKNKTYVTRNEYSALKNKVDQHETDIDKIKRWKDDFDNRLTRISNNQTQTDRDFSSLETKVKTALDLKDDNDDYQYDPQFTINPEDALTGDAADITSMFDGVKRKKEERESKDAYDRQRMAQANIDAQTTAAVTDEQKQDNLTAEQTAELEHEAQKHDSLHEVDEIGHEMDKANEEVEEKKDDIDFLDDMEAEKDKATDHMVEDQVDDKVTEDKADEKAEEKTEDVEPERKPMTAEQRAELRKQAGIIDDTPEKDDDEPDKGDHGDALSALGI